MAVLQGIILGSIAFGRVLAEFPQSLWSALTISVATALVVVVSMFLGILFSLGIDRLRLDPAAGAAPLLTTVADMTGITLLCLSGLAILGSQPDSRPSFCSQLERCAGHENETAL